MTEKSLDSGTQSTIAGQSQVIELDITYICVCVSVQKVANAKV